MRTFAQKSHQPKKQVSSSLAWSNKLTSGPNHHPHPVLRLRRTIGNQSGQRLLQVSAEELKADSITGASTRAAHDFNSGAVIARDDSPEELEARMVGERVRQSPDNVAPLTANHAPDGGKTLSDTGRRYFEPLVGPAVDRARLHVDERAERLAGLAGAKALTYGDDVFIPKARFAPESADGRALLGHELAHVARPQTGRPQLFRQPAVEPHYPTEEEQREIEKLLSREFKAHEASPQAPDQPAVKRGRSLNEEERRALANRLKEPYFTTLDSLDTGTGPSSGSALNEADAFGVAVEARDAIFKRFGSYAHRHFTLTRDETTTRAKRHTDDQVLITFSAAPNIVRDVARTVSTTHCKVCLTELAQLDDESRQAVINALVEVALQERGEQLQRIATARVPGSYNRIESRASLRLKPRTEFYQTTVHELIHALAHPVWNAAFLDEDNINEGFTEYFTQEIVGSVQPSYKEQYERIVSVRDAIQGPFHFASVGGSPEESMRLAYFGGRLDLIGWRPSGPEEEQEVKQAVDPKKPDEGKQWDADTARRYSNIYQAEAQAKQAPSRNVLGVGLYFTKDAADSIAVRYARVIARTEPYAKGQLLLEGQVLGSPVQNPSRLGASLGIGVEYQEPYFYAQAGARFVGTTDLASGANRLDVSPFAGLGIRAWQTLRVGVEGFVAVPVLGGQDIPFGGVATVGIEFK